MPGPICLMHRAADLAQQFNRPFKQHERHELFTLLEHLGQSPVGPTPNELHAWLYYQLLTRHMPCSCCSRCEECRRMQALSLHEQRELSSSL